jgi:hypothetical protein
MINRLWILSLVFGLQLEQLFAKAAFWMLWLKGFEVLLSCFDSCSS